MLPALPLEALGYSDVISLTYSVSILAILKLLYFIGCWVYKAVPCMNVDSLFAYTTVQHVIDYVEDSNGKLTIYACRDREHCLLEFLMFW